MKLIFIGTCFCLSFSFSSLAQDKIETPTEITNKEVVQEESTNVKTTKNNPKVIDFEAEIIEGERKTPTLFLQIGLEKPTMDTVLYQRKDFNDFHGVTKDRRPSYQVPAKK
ncbi:MAG TPA: hypothetical protein PLJ21_04130 [Pseudobdellovibrionaceae bacterium]|nr:hypothetical protein [Pseudobdellovibrionaceae bacterium]